MFKFLNPFNLLTTILNQLKQLKDIFEKQTAQLLVLEKLCSGKLYELNERVKILEELLNVPVVNSKIEGQSTEPSRATYKKIKHKRRK